MAWEEAETCVNSSATVVNYNKRQLQDVSCLEKDENSCKSVLELHLCFNYFTEVPAANLSAYTRLTHLSLSCNNLTAIPPSLHCSCPRLKILRVANNRVAAIENLDGLRYLECLDLRCNRIRCLDNITSLTKLKELSLSGNVMDSVCWVHIPTLPYLHFLGLYGNKLTDLEDFTRQLSQRAADLQSLNIGCNPFSDNRQLSVHNALLSMNHVESDRARDLFLGLGRVFSSASERRNSIVDSAELIAAVESACKVYAQGQDCRRLLAVVQILLKLKLHFPRLEKIDENNLPR